MRTTHQIITGDSGRMSFLESDSIDLVITSPPYPMIAMWDEQFALLNPEIARLMDAGNWTGAFEEMHAVLDRTWKELARVMKAGAVACVNIGDATRNAGGRFRLFSNHARVHESFFALGFDSLPLVLWRKQTNAPTKFMGSGMLPAGAYVTLEHEYILLFRKGERRRFDKRRDKEKRRQSAFFWEERNTWFSDLWDFKGTRQDKASAAPRGRSAEFPVTLPFRLVNMFSLLGDTVLDPFCGTGTTSLAAMAAGRNSVGIDIEEGFFSCLEKKLVGKPGELNRLNLERVENHLRFVSRAGASGKVLRHFNTFFNVPVMTAQEKDLRLVFVRQVEKTGPNCLLVTYHEDDVIRGLAPAEISRKLTGISILTTQP